MMNRRDEIANEYLARNNGDVQAAYDELTTFIKKHIPMENEEFLFLCEARMILKKKCNINDENL